jgi:hypothetical protein
VDSRAGRRDVIRREDFSGWKNQGLVASGAKTLLAGGEEAQKPGLEAVEAAAGGLAFPDRECLPAKSPEGTARAAVAGGVSLDLGEPVVAAGGGDAAGTAVVHVPEAAADLDDFLEAWEDEVWRAGEGSDVEAVAGSRATKRRLSQVEFHRPIQAENR